MERARRHTVPLNRALSKLGILSRAEATAAILAGRVRVNGRPAHEPGELVVPEHVRISVDGECRPRARWRMLLLHKPRGVITTRRDPRGRRTVYDVVGAEAFGLVPIGRLDFATSGLLLFTTDTQLANWITDPANAVPRTYVVTARGWIDEEAVGRLTVGVTIGGERLAASRVVLLKRSRRETHLLVELTEGRNREVRRLLSAQRHEVTRLKRVRLGNLELGGLAPGAWREVSVGEVREAFPGAPLAGAPPGGRPAR